MYIISKYILISTVKLEKYSLPYAPSHTPLHTHTHHTHTHTTHAHTHHACTHTPHTHTQTHTHTTNSAKNSTIFLSGGMQKNLVSSFQLLRSS